MHQSNLTTQFWEFLEKKISSFSSDCLFRHTKISLVYSANPALQKTILMMVSFNQVRNVDFIALFITFYPSKMYLFDNVDPSQYGRYFCNINVKRQTTTIPKSKCKKYIHKNKQTKSHGSKKNFFLH